MKNVPRTAAASMTRGEKAGSGPSSKVIAATGSVTAIRSPDGRRHCCSAALRVAAVREALARQKYLADAGIAGVVLLADRLQKPVLVEGPAGTGKSEMAKAVAAMTGRGSYASSATRASTSQRPCTSGPPNRCLEDRRRRKLRHRETVRPSLGHLGRDDLEKLLEFWREPINAPGERWQEGVGSSRLSLGFAQRRCHLDEFETLSDATVQHPRDRLKVGGSGAPGRGQGVDAHVELVADDVQVGYGKVPHGHGGFDRQSRGCTMRKVPWCVAT
jgi:hypothetical protein